MRVALIAMIAAVLSLGACTSAPAPAPSPAASAPVIVPGRPGEAARTVSPGEAATLVPTPTANASDVEYVQDMIVHHRQALDMAALAPTRAENTRLKSLASRIKDSQAPEIQFMTTWLQQQGQRVPDHHARHEGMPGMATPEQIEALKAASGKEFDRLFLRLMTAHHEGALKMSEQVLIGGSHLRIEELAGDVTATQSAEIRRMLEMQAEL
ncbi:uncharacterized protein (DUF305 family) [Streptosporangium becharense]|uniref:Uncharacterized protein (DUF305 family) n=1 Tax=Streptosporangium becharense TaxID=1816182 RepID=A0A7W9MFR2_9ACTN|nr:DUF305 domain-containing protein [Streptosporangium becharense]MBB2909717.1 uncharacterized protein (DUF305 family) [Streptosporangium becharense]MBB5819327.1 uncharacterized protein (DUF305 family) [Streptosporangium becharense]